MNHVYKGTKGYDFPDLVKFFHLPFSWMVKKYGNAQE